VTDEAKSLSPPDLMDVSRDWRQTISFPLFPDIDQPTVSSASLQLSLMQPLLKNAASAKGVLIGP